MMYEGSTSSTGPVADDLLSKLRAKAELHKEHMKNQQRPPDPAGRPLTIGLALQMEAAPLAPVRSDPDVPQGIGTDYGVLDGVTAQKVAKKVTNRAREYCLVMAFTYDRQDIVDSLKRAKERNVDVVFVID